jgi:hypothetical protein
LNAHAESAGAGNAAMAMDIILTALRAPDAGVEHLVKVLGNRSQAWLRAGNHAAAIRDCTAVLLLRPDNGKAWQRYHAALEVCRHPPVQHSCLFYALKRGWTLP